MMKRNLLYIFFTIFSFSLISAQNLSVDIDAENETMSYTLGTISPEHKIGYSVENISEKVQNWYWDVTPADDFPSTWEIQVCDSELCWDWGQIEVPEGVVNSLAVGEKTEFDGTYINVRSNGTDGTSHIKFNVYADAERTQLIYMSNIPTSIKDLEAVNNLMIYPNPTSDYFRIENDENISSISIQNIVGKEVRKENHTTGMSHSVSDLRNGLYLVRLINDNNKAIKTMRLNKR